MGFNTFLCNKKLGSKARGGTSHIIATQALHWKKTRGNRQYSPQGEMHMFVYCPVHLIRYY